MGEIEAALERYEQAAEAGWARLRAVSREMTAEAYGVPRYPSYAALAEKRRAEERDRAGWLEGISRRLRLVAEVHRCRVWKRGEGDWARRCLRPGCPAGRPLGWVPSQEHALGDALAHAGAFLPLPVYEEPVTKLDLLAFDALADAVRERDEAFAAAFPGRAAGVADRINEYLGGLLPEGMRFEWVTGGE